MKKTLLLTLAAGLVSTTQLMAQVDLYITGATAFRANVHDACKQLFDVLPVYDTATLRYNGTIGKYDNGQSMWTMSGTCSNKITALGAPGAALTLTIHGNFNGSVQGNAAVVNKTGIKFLKTDGTFMTNTPTIAFSDCSSTSTPFKAGSGSYANWAEEQVAVQPFVLCKSMSTNTDMSKITNITWDQMKAAIGLGQISLASFSGLTNDVNTMVTMVQRTKDSGTRRTEFAQMVFGYNAPCTVFMWDVTNNAFYDSGDSTTADLGGNAATGVGIVGGSAAAITDPANLSYGSGYIGGSDLRTVLKATSTNNLSFGYLSIADAKSLGTTNWNQVIPFNGAWPTAAGAGIHGAANNTTNDYSPILTGLYPCWGYEVVIYPKAAGGLAADQNITLAQLGKQTTAGTILGVLDKQTTSVTQTPLVGSIEAEIENSRTNLATGIRISEMHASRASVGGTITP